MRGVAPSKKLLLCGVIHNDNSAYNGEVLTIFWFFMAHKSSRSCEVYGIILEDQKIKDNTVGSRSQNDLAYIAGFLDGDGSLMIQIKKRSDSKKGIRVMLTICFYQDTKHEKPLLWIQKILKGGYLSRRNDGMTELRINGFAKVEEVLKKLLPFIKFKKVQAKAILDSARILQIDFEEKTRRKVLEHILVVQQENYASRTKKSKLDLLKILDLTP